MRERERIRPHQSLHPHVRLATRLAAAVTILLGLLPMPPARGHVPPADSYGVVGCSNTELAVRGYREASTLDLMMAGDLGGGSLREWGDPTDPEHAFYWDQYTQLRPSGGYSAILWQPCIRASDHSGVMSAEHQAWAAEVVATLRELDPGVTIHAVPLNFYEQECPAAGVDGPTVMAELVDWASIQYGLARGPDLGPLAPAELRRDLCHPNGAGRAVLGGQLVEYLDANLVGATAVPDISAPLTVNLGSTPVGSSLDGAVGIANDGPTDLIITSMRTTDPAMSVVTLPPITVPVGGAADVAVRFAPVGEGTIDALLVIESNDPAEPVVTVALQGTATAGAPVADIDVTPTLLDFGTVSVGGSSVLTTTLSNLGSSDLTVTATDVTGAAFTTSGPALPTTLAPGSTTTVDVQFTPAAGGVHSGSLLITSDDPDEGVVSVALTGTGDASVPEADVSVSPAAVDFGSVLLGVTATIDVVVDNGGTADLTISGITVTGNEYSTTTLAPATIVPGGSFTVPVDFSPLAAGASSGDLSITSDDPDEPVVAVPLTGVGQDAPPGPSATSVNAGGPMYTTATGDDFAADQVFAEGSWGYEGGSPAAVTTAIAGTEEDALYQSYRSGNAFSYRFDGLAAGDYVVDLHFIEPKSKRPGLRLIDVTVEGTLVLDDLDIAAASGSRFTAHVETLVASVVDGRLDISFASVGRAAVVSAIGLRAAESTPDSPFSTALLADTVGSTGYSNWTAGETGALPAYRAQSTKDLLVGGYIYGSLDWALWRNLDPEPWDRFSELEPAAGYRAVVALFGILEEDANDGVINAEHEAGVAAVLDEFLARDPNGMIEVVWWTPMIQYENEGSPVSGPALSIAMRDYALSLTDNYPFEILSGPMLGPLTIDLLDPDLRHMNVAGADFIGAQLVEFFDVYGA